MARRERIAAAVLFTLAVAAFASAWRFPYIDIDDPYYYALPKEITGGLSWGGVKWAFTDLSNAIWMPLTWICYQLDYSVRNAVMGWCPTCDGFQLAYTIAHVQSILLHGLNAVLLFGLLRRLGGGGGQAAEKDSKRTTASFVAAAVWAVHPLRAESVAWIASFKDVLSMSFLLLALIKWVDWRERGGAGRYALLHVAFALACMAKPSVVTFPGMVFLLDALVLGKFNPLPLERSRYRAYAPSLAIAVPVAILAQVAQTAGGATAHQAGIPLWYRLLNALVSVGVYVRNFFWPSDLAPQCAIQWPGLPHFLSGGVAVGGAFAVLAAALAWRAWRRFGGGRGATALPGEVRGAYFSAGVLWFAGTMLPMLGISAFGGHAFADRFTYVPAVGFSLALMGAWCGGANAVAGNGRRATAGFAVAAVAVVALLASSWRQTTFWRDDGALARRILEVDGDGNYLAHVTYAKHLFDHERSPESLKEAEAHFTRGYELNPDYCQLSAISYLMLLGETGKADVMDGVRDGFVRWLRERRGIWRCLDMDVAEGLVQLYAGGSGIRHAHGIASGLMRVGNIPAYQPYYFIYCAGVKSGDDAMRRYGIDGIRRLSDPRTGFDGRPNFRFILDGAEAGARVDAKDEAR